MSISEVEKMYGKSSGASRAEQYFTTGRFGDIAFDYPQGTIQKILIYPSEIVTKDQILRTYGEPTERSNEGNDVFILMLMKQMDSVYSFYLRTIGS